MEPFEYDDYSEFDADELDFEIPNRAGSRRGSLRKNSSPFELDIDEDAIEKIRARARLATTEFLNNCDSTRIRAKQKDEAALKQIDEALNRPPQAPKLLPSVRRRRSHGLPPNNVMEEINALEAFGRDRRPLKEKLADASLRSLRLSHERSLEPAGLSRARMSPLRSAGSVPPRREKYQESLDPVVKISARRKIRDIETKLDGILDYEVDAASGFKDMRSALRDINDKFMQHRLLIDRYSGVQMSEDSEPIRERIEAKVEELVPRLPCLLGVQRQGMARSDEITSEFDPRLVPGYSTGICVIPNEGNKELRGRIRNLLCRTRETSRKDARNPHLNGRHEIKVE